MKKALLTAAIVLAGCANNAESKSTENPGVLPELHVIREVTLTKPYSCHGSYETSALFMSEFSKRRNSPDLLYNGSCTSKPTASATTAGDDVSMISDLGAVALEEVTAAKAINLRRISGADNSFQDTVSLVAGHTYSVMISKSEIRALYAFTVDRIQQDGPMTIRYAIKSYSVQKTSGASRGFDWEKGSSK